MNVVNHTFLSGQMIHLDQLYDIVRAVKDPVKIKPQIADIYAFFLERGEGLLSRQSIREGIQQEYINAPAHENFGMINTQIKHMEFSEFLIRLGKLRVFMSLVEEPEQNSEHLIRAMFSVHKMKKAQDAVKDANGGKMPLDMDKDSWGGSAGDADASAPISPTNDDDMDLEEFAKQFQDNLNSGQMDQLKDAIQDMQDFSEALPYLGDILEMTDEEEDANKHPMQAGNIHAQMRDSSLWRDRITHFVANFDLQRSVIYDLAHNLDVALDKADGKSKEYVNNPNPVNVENVDVELGKDPTKATLMEMSQGDEAFYSKLAKGELQQKVYQTPKAHKQCLYILCDCSGSMQGRRHNVAVATIVSLCRKSARDGSVLFVRLFDDDVFPRLDVVTKGLALRAEAEMLTASFSGGGTNINRALQKAIAEIADMKSHEDSEIGKSEILLITDGEDSIDEGKFKKDLKDKDIQLHTVHVGEGGNHYGTSLRDVSTTFNEASVDQAGAMEIVKTVK